MQRILFQAAKAYLVYYEVTERSSMSNRKKYRQRRVGRLLLSGTEVETFGIVGSSNSAFCDQVDPRWLIVAVKWN